MKYISDLGNGKYQNPILYSDNADPDVIRVGNDFFMVTSSFTYVPGLPIFHSKDLINWEIVNYAAKKIPEQYNKPIHGCGVWAPSIRYHDGKFWIFYGDPDLGVFMTNTEDPFGDWGELHLVKEAKGIIDTCPLWDDDGKAYLVHAYANSRCGIKSKLAVCLMSPDGRSIIGEDTIVFDGTENHPTLEGPKFYKINGLYYIMAPAGGVKTGWQVAFRSNNVFGPYEDKIVMRQGDTDINGPHQGGYIELDNGEAWFLHFQDKEEYGRITHLQPVTWIDGWPVMGERIGNELCGQPVKEFRKPDVGQNYPVKYIVLSDDFSSPKLGLQWQWQSNVKENYYSLTERPGHLRIKNIETFDNDVTILSMPNTLTQFWQSPEMTITVKVEINDKATYAGIAVLGFSYKAISLSGEGVLSIHSGEADENGNVDEKIILQKDIGNQNIYLSAAIKSNGMYRFSYSFDKNEFQNFGDEYKATAGNWVGAKTGLFSIGEKDGFADFSEFKVV